MSHRLFLGLTALRAVIVVMAVSVFLIDLTVATARAYPTIHMNDVVNVRVAPNLSGAVVGYQAKNTSPKKIRCAGSGQQIYDTNVWLFIDSDASTGFGGGWLSAYNTDADYSTLKDLQDRYGVPRCDREAVGANGSVYYQPRYSSGDPTVPYTTYTATKDWWAAGDCSDQNAAYFPGDFDGQRITRASAWSLGRLGITYLMKQSPDRAARLNTIILFDPGNLADYTDECDLAYDQDGLMADWLKGDKTRRLLVLAGEVTRDKGHPDARGRLHQGIQQYLFPAIRDAGRSSQVVVCNYNSMRHDDVLRNFGRLARDGSVTTCPGTPDEQPWSP